MIRVIEGQLSANGIRFALVASRFNKFITDQLVSGAIDTIVRHGGSKNDITLAWVPGSLELPLMCKKIAENGLADAIIALGVIIKGATSHYDVVCNQSTSGLYSVSLQFSIPLACGVLTCDNIEQAIERAGTKSGNKGTDAALAAIELFNVAKDFKSTVERTR